MKTMILCCMAVVATVAQVFAQSPAAFTYQLVARDSSGNLITNQNVSFRISILSDSINGQARYVETHARTTNTFGLVVLSVGKGTAKSGSMQAIDWGAAGHFIKTEMDPAGDTSFTLMGTTELLSVPYALYAGKAAPSNIAGTGIFVSGDTIENAAPDQVVVLTPGAGININGTYPSFQVKNMAPDQTVVLNNGNAISITGSYPNFTITNTSPDQTVVLTQGTGITISGTYPNFTITNSQPNATHTGDATGGSALTVVRLQGRNLSANAPATNQVLKWNGSSWTPMTDETRDGCPAGFTAVNSEYCIETNMHDWTGRNWFNSVTTCGNVTGGAHLCNWADWYNACTRAGTLGLSNMTAYWQWVDDGVSTNLYSRVTGGTSGDCTSRDNFNIETGSAYTRCCFSR